MKYCLIGAKLGHSYSAVIHQKRGYDYILNPIEKDKISSFCKENYDGFNITIPYKKDIMEHLDWISEDAKDIGAVNTVVKRDGKLFGYNTDLGGLKYTLDRANITLLNKNVLVLGSGGASVVAVALCKKEKANKVTVVSRSGEVNYQNVYEKESDTNVIINTTPVGMYPNCDDSPISLKEFKKLESVVDVIYNPYRTKLLQEARDLSLSCTSGLAMLVEQALLAEDIWSNTTHSESESEDLIAYLSQKTANVVLFGMPSCGKSTIGKALAKELDREFLDTDELIKQKTGKSPSTIIKESGEKVFRDIESEVIKSVGILSSKVISLGGGGVLRRENVLALQSNGVLCYVKRPLELLENTDRPLSMQKGVQKLWKERKDIYESAKDISIDNTKTVFDAVKEIIEKYEIACYKRS